MARKLFDLVHNLDLFRIRGVPVAVILWPIYTTPRRTEVHFFVFGYKPVNSPASKAFCRYHVGVEVRLIAHDIAKVN